MVNYPYRKRHQGTHQFQELDVTGNVNIRGSLVFGDVATDTLTVNGLLNCGSSSSPTSYAAGTPVFTLYATNAGTSGSTSAEPFYVKSTLSGAGQVGGRARFHAYSNVASGGWINALKAYMEFGSSGRTTGLASSMNMEMTMPNATVASGAYFPCELEMIYGASTAYTGNVGYIYANITGTATNFDTNGVFFWLDGLTAGADKLLSATSQTLRCKVGAAATVRYNILSQMQDGLGLGNSTTAMSLGTSTTQRAIDVYTTSSSTSGSTSIRPIYMKSEMTGAGGVGGRAEFYMTTNVALGGWSNALKGYVEYGASGRTTGLGSAVCAELKLSAGTTSGSYAPMEVELVLPSGSSTGTKTAFMYLAASGDNVAAMDTAGYLFKLDGLTAASGKLFQVNTAGAATHALRIDIGGTAYYIMLTDTGA